MGTKRSPLLLVFALVGLTAFSGTSAAADTIEVRETASGASTANVLVEVPRGSNSVTKTVFLAQPGGTPQRVIATASVPGARVAVGASGGVLVVPPGGQAVPVVVTVDDLLIPGERKGTLFFTANGVALGSVDLTITKPDAPSVLVEKVSPGTAVQPFGIRPATVALHVQLQETSGHDVIIRPPVLLSLVNDSGSTDTRYTSLSVDGVADGQVWVPAGQRIEIIVRVAGLEAPAKYSAQLGMVTSAGGVISAPISFTVSRPWWFAALLIAVGVALSGVVRYFLVSRQMLGQRLQLQLLSEDPDSLLDRFKPLRDGEIEVVSAVRAQVDDMTRRMTLGLLPKSERLDAVAEKIRLLPRYVAARRRVEDMAADTTRLGQVRSVEAYLRASLEEPDLGSLCDQARSALDSLDQASRQAIKDRIDDLRRQGSDRPEVDQHASEATKAAGEGNLSLAETELAAGHQVAAAGELRHLVEGPAPVGVEPADWRALRARVDGTVDHEGLRTVTKEYLRTVTAGLSKATDQHLRQVSGNTELAAPLQDVAGALTEAAAALADDQVEAARSHYDRARTDYTDFMADRGAQMGNGKPADVAAAPPVPVTSPVTTEPIPSTLARPLPAAKIRHRQIWLDGLMTAILALVAVLLGLQILYLPEPAWGNTSHILIAVLWGLGLHPVGGAVFGGLQNLRDRISAAPGERAGEGKAP